jgi:hypothetical protein
MSEIDTVASLCGVLVSSEPEGNFDHRLTAWAVGPGEWVTAWDGEEPPVDLKLLCARDGALADIGNWELGDGIAGFTSIDLGEALGTALVHEEGNAALTSDHPLHKRDEIWALGYPAMIDHPSFRLHRGSLTPERYYPYLCPWVVQGYLALFGADHGFLAGQFFPGMAGGPVVNHANEVVGVILDGAGGAEHPPLIRFRRLA